MYELHVTYSTNFPTSFLKGSSDPTEFLPPKQPVHHWQPKQEEQT